MVEELKFVSLIKDSFMFAASFTVITPDADIVVTIEGFFEITKLGIQYFLRPENIGRHKVHLVANDLAAFGPHLAVDAVIAILVADVIGSDKHFLGGKVQGCHYEGKEKEFFH